MEQRHEARFRLSDVKGSFLRGVDADTPVIMAEVVNDEQGY